MPMGIVSDNDFLSELSNVVTPSQPISRTNIPTTITPTNNPLVPQDDIDGIMDPVDSPELRSHQGVVTQIKSKGRSEGDVNVPTVLQKIIGETAAIEGRSAALDLAKQFGISESSVSAYAVGATSTASYNEPDAELKNYIDTRKKKLSKKALNRLNLAIHHITRQKMVDAKLGEIVLVANAMSQVVKNLAPPEPKTAPVTVENKPVFMLYAPTQKSEDKYEVVHSRE